MPYPFNNVAIPDVYGDTGTVVFPRPTLSMTVQGFNNSFYYRLLYVPAGQQVNAYQADPVEHYVAPGMILAFDETDLPVGGSRFAGVMFRNNIAGQVAQITVY